MRLWSIHPKYLDVKGFVGLWREALLAKHVLQGKTKSYIHHPQLLRFRCNKAIGLYLMSIYDEACRRGYCFDKRRIGKVCKEKKIQITKGQIEYEFKHLKSKLRKRDPKKYKELLQVKKIEANPVFAVVKGPIESWEKV